MKRWRKNWRTVPGTVRRLYKRHLCGRKSGSIAAKMGERRLETRRHRRRPTANRLRQCFIKNDVTSQTENGRVRLL